VRAELSRTREFIRRLRLAIAAMEVPHEDLREQPVSTCNHESSNCPQALAQLIVGAAFSPFLSWMARCWRTVHAADQTGGYPGAKYRAPWECKIFSGTMAS